MYFYGPLHMAEQRQGDQLAPTYSSSVGIRGVAMRICRKRWTTRRGGERGSRISVLMARQDDDDDDAIQTIQFSISMQFSSIWPIDRVLSGATIPGQSGPGSNGNEGVLRIPQSSSITGTSPSDCLVSYQDTHWGESYPSAAVQSVYFTSSADWAIISRRVISNHWAI